MTPRPTLPTLAGASLGLLVALTAGDARAQFDSSTTSGSNYSVALTTQTVYRFYPDGTPYPFRAANLNPNDINFQDCEDNIVLQFQLTEGGLGTTGSPDILQIWAGTTDCTQPTARAGAESPFCWQVYPAQEPTLTSTINIFARSLTRFVDTTLSSVPNGGNPIIGAGQPESACHTQTSSGEVGLSIYFMFLPNTGDATPDASTTYSLNVDLVGPLSPTSLTAGIGDQLLLINWTPQVDPTIQGYNIYAEDQGPNGLGLFAEAGVATLTTPIYCKGGGAVEQCPDAGSVSTDGAITDAVASVDACTLSYPDGSAYVEVADAASLASLSDASLTAMGCTKSFPTKTQTTAAVGASACTSSVLVDVFTANVTDNTTSEAGVVSTVGDATVTTVFDSGISTGTLAVGISQVSYALYGVGNVGGNTTSSYNIDSIPLPDGGTTSLVDGHQYAIAVAAYDEDGNVGLLSPLACQTPEPITDFWSQYKEDGGLAGGGFCALEAPGVSLSGSVFGMGIAMVLFAHARRRRRQS